MREVITQCAAWLAALLLLSCASSKPASDTSARESDRSARTAPAPELVSSADARFIARHAAILEALSPLDSAAVTDPRAVDARSIMAGAEEMYLRGRTEIALELLGEAEAALKRGD